MDDIKNIVLSELRHHPDNPRLIMRQDVIDGIAAQIEANDNIFHVSHSLLVRPVDGYYQILRGHHRYEAAKKAGLESVPCWVHEMDDDAAYMQLALSNVQGELSPLEIGIHALKAIDLSDGGRGLTGGLSEYARQLGQTKGYITQVRQAAEVMSTIKPFTQVNSLLGKAKHLSHIHKAPETVWPILVEWVVTPKNEKKPDSTPTVSQTKNLVKEIAKFDIPEQWQQIFLSLPDVVSLYLSTDQPSPSTVSKLVSEATKIEKLIKANADLDREKFPYTIEEFHKWLIDGIGAKSWSSTELQKYGVEIIQAISEAQKLPEPEPQPGEWWELGDHLLYCGDTSQPDFWGDLPRVAFVFADPPYNANAADWDSGFEWGHDWLTQKGEIVAVTPGIEAIDRFFKNDVEMPYKWSMSCHIKNGTTRGKLGYGNWIYIAIFSEKDSINQQSKDIIEVSIKTSETDETDHKGRKPSDLLSQLIEKFTNRGDTVIDPFLGSGTTLFQAENLGRCCIGGEIEPGFCKDIIIKWQEQTGRLAERRDK